MHLLQISIATSVNWVPNDEILTCNVGLHQNLDSLTLVRSNIRFFNEFKLTAAPPLKSILSPYSFILLTNKLSSH